jgi:hypothetical protein
MHKENLAGTLVGSCTVLPWEQVVCLLHMLPDHRWPPSRIITAISLVGAGADGRGSERPRRSKRTMKMSCRADPLRGSGGARRTEAGWQRMTYPHAVPPVERRGPHAETTARTLWSAIASPSSTTSRRRRAKGGSQSCLLCDGGLMWESSARNRGWYENNWIRIINRDPNQGVECKYLDRGY